MAKQTPPTTPPAGEGAESAPGATAAAMEKRYRIVPSGAGGFKQNDLVTEDQIKEKGGTLSDWLEIGSVVPDGEPDPVRKVVVPRKPRLASSTSVEGLPKPE